MYVMHIREGTSISILYFYLEDKYTIMYIAILWYILCMHCYKDLLYMYVYFFISKMYVHMYVYRYMHKKIL